MVIRPHPWHRSNGIATTSDGWGDGVQRKRGKRRPKDISVRRSFNYRIHTLAAALHSVHNQAALLCTRAGRSLVMRAPKQPIGETAFVPGARGEEGECHRARTPCSLPGRTLVVKLGHPHAWRAWQASSRILGLRTRTPSGRPCSPGSWDCDFADSGRPSCCEPGFETRQP